METPHIFWITETTPPVQDHHVAFRSAWELAEAKTIRFRILGASWYVVWLDGVRYAEGPARFSPTYPEYQEYIVQLPAGPHVLAIQVNACPHETRMLPAIAPFLWVTAHIGNETWPIVWRGSALHAYTSEVRRVNPQLGSIEWCDTRDLPDWQSLDFDDSSWAEPLLVQRALGSFIPLSSGLTRETELTPQLLAEGKLVEFFGYERDDPVARFYLRTLDNLSLPPQGVWRRYDMGRVRLMRPRFKLNLPAGAIVEFAYAEHLTSGRVAPWITLSCGDSCNLDHYIARGGLQEFAPLAPRGGRFLEIHIIAPPDEVYFIEERIVDRGYYGDAQGEFQSGDPLLDRIWQVGVETHRACAEDTLTDNPTRERGQWMGDIAVGLEIAASAFGDLRLCRRALWLCAHSARSDGLVAGLCPGNTIYLSTFAAQWISACVQYLRLTGDHEFLHDLYPHAERNITAFEACRTVDGVSDDLGWAFVDWGYVRNPGPTDMGLNLHYLAAIRDMVIWSEARSLIDRASHYRRIEQKLRATIAQYFAGEFDAGPDAWIRIGYHRSVLGLRLGFFDGTRERACVEVIQSHMLNCFPNTFDAPRLSDPAVNNPRLITPYFAHYAMPALIERDETDFVLDQYRRCWGWLLEDGRTTWLEVFDPRWSHCHQWSGSPTWQLSRYLLGLHPRYDLGERHFDLRLHPGSLDHANGSIPLPGSTEQIQIAWHRTSESINIELRSPLPLTLRLPDKSRCTVDEELTLSLAI